MDSTATGYTQVEIPKGASSSQGNCLLTGSLQNTILVTLPPAKVRSLCRFRSDEGLSRRTEPHRSFPQLHWLQRDWQAPVRAHLGKDEQHNGLLLLCVSTAGHFVQLERKRRWAEAHFMQLESHRLLDKSRGGSASGSNWTFYRG